MCRISVKQRYMAHSHQKRRRADFVSLKGIPQPQGLRLTVGGAGKQPCKQRVGVEFVFCRVKAYDSNITLPNGKVTSLPAN